MLVEKLIKLETLSKEGVYMYAAYILGEFIKIIKKLLQLYLV